MIEQKNIVRVLILYIEHNNEMEASAVISEAKSLVINTLYHKSHSETISIHKDLVKLLHGDGYVSQFKMTIGCTNTPRKDHFNDESMGIAVTETLTNISAIEKKSRYKNNMINNFSNNQIQL